MEKSRKTNLKKTILMSIMSMSLLSLTGCGEKQVENRNEEDEHAIVSIGDNTIIFRSCDENYSIETRYYVKSGIMEIEIYDEKGNLIDTVLSSNGNFYQGDNQGMVDIENELLENGAYLYQYKMNK